MADVLRIKRRTGGAPGAPTSLANAELAYNEIDHVLYYGEGTGGAGGSATIIVPVGGSGYVDNKMRWVPYTGAGQAFSKNDLTRDGDWTMVANKATTTKPGPQSSGAEKDLLPPWVPATNSVRATYAVYNEWTTNTAGWVSKYGGDVLTQNLGAVHAVTLTINGVVRDNFTGTPTNVGLYMRDISPIVVASGAVIRVNIQVTQVSNNLMYWVEQAGLFSTAPTYCSAAVGSRDGAAASSTAYGCHLTFMPGTASPDWDMVSFGGAAAGSGTAGYLPLSGGTMTGLLTLSGDPVGTLDAATKAYADIKAPLASPALTGIPTAPTASVGTNSTQLATTAFVTAAMTGAGAITEAPSDGKYYARRNAAWADTAPAYVDVTGDTMTGNLTVSGGSLIRVDSTGNSFLALRKAAGAYRNTIVGETAGGAARWSMVLGGSGAETGGGAGSDFSITRYDDAGTTLDNPIFITRATGLATVLGDPTTALGIATKQYADGKVAKTGDTMTGTLTVPTINCPVITQTVGTGGMFVSAGSGQNVGARLEFYGEGHASWPNQAYYNAVSHTFRNNTASATFGFFDANGLTLTGSMALSGWVLGTGGNAALCSQTPGTIYFRPNGSGSSAGQVTIDTAGSLAAAGNVTASGAVLSGQSFISQSSAVVLGSTVVANLYFRPQGYTSATNQTYINTAGTLVCSSQIQADTYVANGGATNPGSTNAHTINLGFIDTSRNVSALSACHRFFTPNGLAGQITTTNATTAYGTSSDIRLKTDLGPATDARTMMDAIKVIQYEQTGPIPIEPYVAVQGAEPPADQTLIGVSAQQLYTIYPHAVIPPAPEKDDDYDPDARPGEKGFLPWMVDHSKLVPMLMATLQQACARIDDLEARIAALEAA